MGYITDFKLKVTPDTIPNIVEEVSDISDYLWDDELCMNGKWYDWPSHMKELSKRYPEHMFQLDGDGEDSDDIWRVYFKNGKSHDANTRLIYEDFDERLLK